MIASVISYCTNDFRFLGKCIEEAKKFSSQVVIPVCDHFFDGRPENRSLLQHTFAVHTDCTFIEYAYTPGKLYNPLPTFTPSDEGWVRLWHQTSRYIGYLHLRPEIEYVFFLDSDEIAEGERVAAWLQMGEYRNWSAQRLLGYYYALTPVCRADKLQNVALLVKRRALEPRFFFHTDERYALYRYVDGPKRADVRDGRPFFHHYSWVRPPSECAKKAGSWGHKDERDWQEEILRAFAGSQALFGNGDLKFEEIPQPYFDPLTVEIPTDEPPAADFPHVKKVFPRDILQLELELTYGLCDDH